MASHARTHAQGSVLAIRRFNRFYTGQIGLLQQGLLDSPYSLTEVRILYEIAHRHLVTATDLSRDLNLDAGYLSRILANFRKCGWIYRTPSAVDRRQSLLALTTKGMASFHPLEDRSNQQVEQMLSRLSPHSQQHLIAAMHSIEQILSPAAVPAEPYALRTQQPGDMG